MDKRALPVTARKLELRQTQQGIFGLRREWIVDYYVLVVALRIRRVRCKTGSPV